jgi:plasmid stabilization system protein ParE
MSELRVTMKGLVHGTVVSRERNDLRAGLQMASSGRHRIFFEVEPHGILVVRVLHDRMDYLLHL